MSSSFLKQAMDRRGMPRVTLKHQIQGIHYTYVLRHYRGEREVSAKHALVYEQLLGIPRSELRPDLWPPADNEHDEKDTQEAADGAAC